MRSQCSPPGRQRTPWTTWSGPADQGTGAWRRAAECRCRLIAVVLWLACPDLQAGGSVEPGLALGSYPELLAIPGIPVYYAPRLKANYFFHHGWYWVFERDRWFRAAWYNGPWQEVVPDRVPLFVLRIPIAYYAVIPDWFGMSSTEAPPRWTVRWGEAWGHRHSGWDQWNHKSVRAIAPLPSYQQRYSGPDYPQPKVQHLLQLRNYPTLGDCLASACQAESGRP